MALSEFDLIQRFFAHGCTHRQDTILAIGDDAALVAVPPNNQLAVTTDTLVAGVHFFADVAPEDLAYKALAVNLSDLAAMGAEPAWISLALTLPNADAEWLARFAGSLCEQCNYYGVELIGGDTTRGPLSITITAQGWVPQQMALTRSAAKPGDIIYVTGTLGDAAAGLKVLQQQLDLGEAGNAFAIKRLLRPTPRVLVGNALRTVSQCAIDLSDGLAADLGHIIERSGVGAQIEVSQLPYSEALSNLSLAERLPLMLAGGDDYELCFTAAEEDRGRLETQLKQCGVPYSAIGRIIGGDKLRLTLNGEPYQLPERSGWDHFKG